MKTYAGKRVVSSQEKVEGYILEINGDGLILRKYFRNEFGNYMLDEREDWQLDIDPISSCKKPFSKIREISKQLELSDYYVSEDAVSLIDSL